MKVALLALVLGLAPSLAHARQEPALTELADEVSLARLMDLCAERLNINLEYDPTKVTGNVTLRLGGGVTDEELWSLANRLLAARQMASVQLPGEGSLSIVPLAQAAGLARIETDLTSARAGFVKFVYEPAHRSAREISEALTALVTPGAGRAEPLLREAASTTAPSPVVLADLAPRVLELVDVARRIDTAALVPSWTEVTLVHRRATDVITQVDRAIAALTAAKGSAPAGKVLALSDETGILVAAPADAQDRWVELIGRFDRPLTLESRTYLPRHHGVEQVVPLLRALLDTDAFGKGLATVFADPLSGSILVRANAAQHALAEDLFSRLQARGTEARPELRAFPLKQRSTRELLPILSSLIGAGQLTAGSGAAGDASTPSEPPTVPPATEVAASPNATPTSQAPAIELTEDAQTNRILAFGEPALLEQLGRLIQSLDVRAPQVLIEAFALTLTESQSQDLGVELRALLEDGDTLVQLTSAFGLGGPGVGGPLPTGAGAGFSGVALAPGDYSALLRALQTVNQGRSLSVPRVLVRTNETANLDSVLESPFLSTNASDTVATTSFGGSLSAGTTIEVTPTLLAGDQLALDYRVTVSSFAGEAPDPALPPPRQQNTLSSVVTLPDGFAVVLGGLELSSRSKGSTRTPLLADIPLLGALFRSDSKSSDATKFYVFLRARVMRSLDFGDLRAIGNPLLDEHSIDDGWPKVEPRWIR